MFKPTPLPNQKGFDCYYHKKNNAGRFHYNGCDKERYNLSAYENSQLW